MPVIEPMLGAAINSNWNVMEIDGHDDDIWSKLKYGEDQPTLIVAETIKGKGVSFMENQPKWHSNWLGGDFLKQAREELS